MRFDQAVIPLAPRTTLNCLDMAFAFVRQGFAPLAGLWSLVAVPVCTATYFVVDRYDGNLLDAMLLFWFATALLAILVTTGAALCTFGEPFTVRSTLQRLRRVGGWLIVHCVGWRVLTLLALPLMLVPGLYIALRTGFVVEKRVLSDLGGHLHDRRTSELLKGEIWDLALRGFGILLFCGLLWLSMVLTIDFVSTSLLGLPILWGRLNVDFQYVDSFVDGVDYIADFFWSDPIVVTTALACALAAYVPGRLAWFFCYIDVRVRRDCWDMELEILREAERLEAA